MLGKVAVLPALVQYAFILTLAGFALGLMGWAGFKVIAVPLLFLVFMIPLPSILHQGLSTSLQLISSQLGVAFIELCGIDVLLDSNIIDLGNYQLQVTEACNGLRYLFPLAFISFLCAYLFQGSFWKRAVIFLSSAPITLFMNSLRLGIIGILVEHWGIGMAEGFMHDFEGWMIYGACLGLLILEMGILARIGGEKTIPVPSSGHPIQRLRSVPAPALVSLALLMVFSGITYIRETQAAIQPGRNPFSEFPMIFDNWHGQFKTLSSATLKTLQPDDYLLADYVDKKGQWINLHMAYFISQQTGAAVHSPRYCFPGGGWTIQEQAPSAIDEIEGVPLTVNRTVVKKGDAIQLVYYWFRQQGRNITDVYRAKWYLFQDSLTRHRADGALVRMTTSVGRNETIKNAKITPLLPE